MFGYVTSASRYQSISSMYIRDLIPRNSMVLVETFPIVNRACRINLKRKNKATTKYIYDCISNLYYTSKHSIKSIDPLSSVSTHLNVLSTILSVTPPIVFFNNPFSSAVSISWKHMYKQTCLNLWRPENPEMGTLANSEDQDEMPHCALVC